MHTKGKFLLQSAEREGEQTLLTNGEKAKTGVFVLLTVCNGGRVKNRE